MKLNAREKMIYGGVFVLWIGYFLLGQYAPKQPSPYSFSPVATILLTLSIAVPFLVAWIAGCYAGTTLLLSVPTMQEKEDKIAFTRIAYGMFSLIGGLIIASLIGSAKPYVVGDATLTAVLTIITNYLYILGPLVGFACIFSGSGHLRRTEGDRLLSGWLPALGVGLALFSAVYLWLTFTNTTRQVGVSAQIQASYFLSDALIVATIILPFLVTQVLTFFSVARLVDYYRSSTGAIYKQAATYLIVGCLSVMGGADLLQALLSLGSTRLLGLGLGALLLIVYAFLAFKTFGFFYLALGARKLATIEKVMQKYESSKEPVA